ncbi:hypothetical protein Hypma_010723 [Hypsizygus marmoreus]|uniref:DUF7918 domain-containing protein n=1 Tax=Hypsizygus marmoreus TaxID=39966 RepID=A0A369JJ19_HYPMA|nr:hypothetical protein Hypma_010723 [Hypsizygus marmoreus]
MALRFQDFAAWVTMEGQQLQVFTVETPQPNYITCWIASEPGKKIAVHWANASQAFTMTGSLTIDGVVCNGRVLYNTVASPHQPNTVTLSNVRTSNMTCRDFVFSDFQTTDDDAYLHTVDQARNSGTIVLELRRYFPLSVTSRPMEPNAKDLQSPIVHERSKVGGAHCIAYGDEYYSPAPMMNNVAGRTLDAAPYVTFVFKYRPMPLLMADGIVPRPITPHHYPSVNPRANPQAYPRANPPVNPSVYPRANPPAYPPANPPAYPSANPPGYPPANPPAYPPANPPTFPPENPQAYPLANPPANPPPIDANPEAMAEIRRLGAQLQALSARIEQLSGTPQRQPPDTRTAGAGGSLPPQDPVAYFNSLRFY